MRLMSFRARSRRPWGLGGAIVILLFRPWALGAQDTSSTQRIAPHHRSTLLVGFGGARAGAGLEYVHRPVEHWGVGVGVGIGGISGRLIASPVVARTRGGQGWWPYVSGGGLMTNSNLSQSRAVYGGDVGLQYRGWRKQVEVGVGFYRDRKAWPTYFSVAFGWGLGAAQRPDGRAALWPNSTQHGTGPGVATAPGGQ
ncbi:MAG: hypothetical protein IPK85_04755 [Gemmatimonadetes bacterium]|nr:hypothetical protein [Gemmatimonadota bacterium]